MGRVGGVEIFRNRPERPWCPPSIYKMCTGSFPGVKRPERGVDHPPPYKAEVKERVETPLLHFWDFVGCYRMTFTFTETLIEEIWYQILKSTYRRVAYYHYAENDEHRKFLE